MFSLLYKIKIQISKLSVMLIGDFYFGMTDFIN